MKPNYSNSMQTPGIPAISPAIQNGRPGTCDIRSIREFYHGQARSEAVCNTARKHSPSQNSAQRKKAPMVCKNRGNGANRATPRLRTRHSTNPLGLNRVRVVSRARSSLRVAKAKITHQTGELSRKQLGCKSQATTNVRAVPKLIGQSATTLCGREASDSAVSEKNDR